MVTNTPLFLAMACGLILDTVTRGRQEAKRVAYLSVPGPDFENPGPGSATAGNAA